MALPGSPFSSPGPNSHQNFAPRTNSGPFNVDVSGGGPVQSSATVSFGALKPPKPPEKPLVPYMRFSRKMWHQVRKDNPESQLWDIGRKIGGIWREMSDSEKRIYQEEYEVEKAEYDRQMKIYHNSAAYQSYVASKNRAKMEQQQQQQQSQSVALPSRGESRQPQHVRVESGVFIQAVDEDDGESQVTVRRLAASRFDRNHRLISDLFSDSVVQDTRSVVTQQRINMLKRQAASLSSHQKNLENELAQLEERFEAKKRQIESCSQNFSDRLKKVCQDKPVIDQQRYQWMVRQATERLLNAYELYRQRHQLSLANVKHSEEENRQNSENTINPYPHNSVVGKSENPLSADACNSLDKKKHEPVTEQISNSLPEESKGNQERETTASSGYLEATLTGGNLQEDEEGDDGELDLSESENHLLDDDDEEDED